MTRVSPMLLVAALLASFAVSGCVPFSTVGIGGGGGGQLPLTCDTFGAGEDAAKIEAFLDTSARLESESVALAAELEATCGSIAEDLGVSVPYATEGQMQVEATCVAVAHEIEAILDATLPRDATFELEYDAPVCTVDFEAMASCVASCDADLSASSEIECSENVVGTSCYGDSEVRADAQCETACEARVDLRAECTEPSLLVTADLAIDLEDQVRLDNLVSTLDAHYPRFLALEARIVNIAESGAELASSLEGAADATGRLGLRAMACFADASAATIESMHTVSVTVSVTVEVSASVNAG